MLVKRRWRKGPINRHLPNTPLDDYQPSLKRVRLGGKCTCFREGSSPSFVTVLNPASDNPALSRGFTLTASLCGAVTAPAASRTWLSLPRRTPTRRAVGGSASDRQAEPRKPAPRTQLDGPCFRSRLGFDPRCRRADERR
jgi:hypothetical protein